MSSEEAFDPEPTAEDLLAIGRLTQPQIREIDLALLSNVQVRWGKVAMVVGKTMRQLDAAYPHLPDVYFSSRLADLVRAGKLQSQGDLRRMRFSEVRLAGG